MDQVGPIVVQQLAGPLIPGRGRSFGVQPVVLAFRHSVLRLPAPPVAALFNHYAKRPAAGADLGTVIT